MLWQKVQIRTRVVTFLLSFIVVVLLVRIGSTYRSRLTGAARVKLEESERRRIANLQQYHILEEEDESDFLKHRIEVETQSKESEGVGDLEDHVETIDPTLDMEQALLEAKLRLVDSVLESRLFETQVGKFPPLAPLFEEYEKDQSFFMNDVKMSDYDKSCNAYYEDSAGTSGEFNKEAYLEREYLYKVHNRNITGELKEPTCDRQAKFGCCSSCRTTSPEGNNNSCCLCSYDGQEDIFKNALEPGNAKLQIDNELVRGFDHYNTDEGKKLGQLYGKAMESLGFEESAGTDHPEINTDYMLDYLYLPPEGFLMWHTSQHDNSNVPYRMYLISVDEDKGSFFKYQQASDGKVIELPDFHGALRIFKNAKVDGNTGQVSHLWHTHYSKTSHMHCIGIEIRPEQIVALLDSCDTCWDDFKELEDEI